MTISREHLGRFVWHDLMTPLPSESVGFYGALFPEWGVEPIDVGESGTYHEIRVAGLKSAGVVELKSEAETRPYWLGSVQVEDVQLAVDRTVSLQGTVVVAPVDAPTVGRFAVIRDAQKTRLRVIEPARDPVLPETPASGQFCWNELLTSDVSSARGFYQSVFGWSAIDRLTSKSEEYTLLRAGENDVAGIMPPVDNFTKTPAWLTCLYAEDLESRFVRAKSLGAEPVVEPRDIAEVGRFCILTDPLGAPFAMMRLSR